MDSIMKVLDKSCKNKRIALTYKPELLGWTLTKGPKSTFVSLKEITEAETEQIIIHHIEDCIYTSTELIPLEAQMCDCPREIIPPGNPKKLTQSIIGRME